MIDAPLQPTVFFDTQTLIYAFDRREERALEVLDAAQRDGLRMVLTEDTLYEFGQSETLDSALHLTRCALGRNPIWLRSFSRIQADELWHFVRCGIARQDIERAIVFREDFQQACQVDERSPLDPIAFTELTFDAKMREQAATLQAEHASVVNGLSSATKLGSLTEALKLQALQTKVEMLLAGGTELCPPIEDFPQLDTATKFCLKHRKRMMRECRSIVVEYHLADYRSANPKRVARLSDSRDLTIASAAYPYVSRFVTNDGYLFGALQYVRKQVPFIETELTRLPPLSNAA